MYVRLCRIVNAEITLNPVYPGLCVRWRGGTRGRGVWRDSVIEVEMEEGDEILVRALSHTENLFDPPSTVSSYPPPPHRMQ